MKGIIKVRSCCFSIVLLLVAMLSIENQNVDENNIEDYLKSDCKSVADYIEDHFDSFVLEYNNSIEEDEMKLNASYIEFKKNVYNVTLDSDAVYLDFDGDNGYAVVGNDYSFLDFKTTGDLEYLRNQQTLYYSEYDGFVYKTDYGYARFNQVYEDENFLNSTALEGYYDGQNKDYGEGSGNITDSDAYIKSRYGSGFSLETNKVLSGYKSVLQNDYNNYTKDGYGEGNCTLSAMLGIMQYLRDYKGMNSLPTSRTFINPKNDFFYDNLISNGYEAFSRTVPTIYYNIRKVAINYGYRAESTVFTSINMANLYRDAMASMGYQSSSYKRYAYLVLVWSFESQVKKEIDAGFPTMWNTGRGQYGSHSMVVKGYKRYSKTHKVWFIKWKEYKNLMIVNDNWSSYDTCFDLDAYGNNLIKEGFGTFLQVRNYQY